MALLSFAGLFLALIGQQWWRAASATPADIRTELGPLLSPGASIILPDSPLFANATTRWQTWRSPDVTVAVQVATEEDVQQTVLYANSKGLPFLAKAGGHGAIYSLGNIHNGIEIWMKSLNEVEVSPDGSYVTIGGGAKSLDVSTALWAAGKQTVTGLCECVGVVAPMLGGGHGILQGEHGLMADQLLEARVVLANGTAVTLPNASHPDMFWAMRGAGHNFGIITEFKYKVYDVIEAGNWTIETFTYTSSQLEKVYSVTNDLAQVQPPRSLLFSFFSRLPRVDPVNAAITYFMLYETSAPRSPMFNSSGLTALNPVAYSTDQVSYLAIPGLTGNGNADPACQNGFTALRFPIDLQSYEIIALRKVFDSFGQIMQDVPAFNNSFLLLEGYGTQGVEAVPSDSTAYAMRKQKLLVSPVLLYAPNTSLDSQATAFGEEARKTLLPTGDQMHSYVNYAHGTEPPQAWYGYEPWRLERLQRLKAQYDPAQRFSYYAPIPLS